MITHVIVELKKPVKEEYFHMDTVLPSEYYGYGAPLVLCKDCKHLTHSPHKWYCSINRKVVAIGDYCSDGERE